MAKYTLLKKEGNARRGTFETVHGTVQTPAFMNVATAAAIKGGLSTEDLEHIGCQVMLCNTYHLHVRPGDDLVADMGGLHRFTDWKRPILTDSGGFQVFSLAKLNQIKEEGVTFHSHVNGKKIFMGPEESMQIQSHLASTIAMAFDECVENPATYNYAKQSCARTLRWLERCKAEMERLNALPDTINKDQLLFGINQGCTYDDLRVWHMQEIAKLDCDGYAIGGLAVGEPAEDMYRIISAVEPYMPADKPRYLMGVGISLPGILDKEGQTLVYSHALGLRNVPTEEFSRYIPFSCRFINDANAAGLAEVRDLESPRSLVYLSLSNSVGGAILTGGALYGGDHLRAGEFGHNTLVPDGRPCYCGKKGCLDAYCSAKVLSRLTDGNLALFFDGLRSGDAALQTAWNEYLSYLAVAVNNLRMTFDCDVIVGGYVGGFLAEFGEPLREMLVERNTFEPDSSYLKFSRYKLEASALGAALLHIEAFIQNL